MSHLPNHIYYPQLTGMDQRMVFQHVQNVMLYSALELLSFLILQHFIKKRLQLSASLQLAFVLESQWEMVQSKLVLWVVYIVQASLVHFGTQALRDVRESRLSVLLTIVFYGFDGVW
jgi:hypothetical protein